MDSVTYARRFDKVTGSAIREIFKVLGRPGMISFAGGNPSLDALPDRLCADLARDVLLADGKRILQYGATEGYPPFLAKPYGLSQVALRLLHGGRRRASHPTGSTSGMDLLLKALVNPGDAVLVESPTFLGNMQTMHLYEANLIPIESDEGGVRLDVLGGKRRAGIIPSCFTVIPTFQNPSGRTLGRRPAGAHRGAGRQVRLHRGRGRPLPRPALSGPGAAAHQKLRYDGQRGLSGELLQACQPGPARGLPARP